MNEQRRIKCAFCDWTTTPFRTSRRGIVHSGMGRLRSHIEDEHPAEYERIYERDDAANFYEEQRERRLGEFP